MKYCSTAGSCSCKMVGFLLCLCYPAGPFMLMLVQPPTCHISWKDFLYFLFSITDFTAFPIDTKKAWSVSMNSFHRPLNHDSIVISTNFFASNLKKQHPKNNQGTYHFFKAWSNKYPYFVVIFFLFLVLGKSVFGSMVSGSYNPMIYNISQFLSRLQATTNLLTPRL